MRTVRTIGRRTWSIETILEMYQSKGTSNSFRNKSCRFRNGRRETAAATALVLSLRSLGNRPGGWLVPRERTARSTTPQSESFDDRKGMMVECKTSDADATDDRTCMRLVVVSSAEVETKAETEIARLPRDYRLFGCHSKLRLVVCSFLLER
ncbi:unnamed protein product [Soboliphyme baturini]|uniref:Uncharacterized protein n=1 Tax=Soboliphyme baturini TaxID=241478 RepID=A0A183ICL3_9BILA|nr:unnamed protein product [Soboliphyme baturini]